MVLRERTTPMVSLADGLIAMEIQIIMPKGMYISRFSMTYGTGVVAYIRKTAGTMHTL
jgi:hypothetical protein